MRLHLTFALLAACLVSIAALAQPLSGTYTINSSGGNYTSFSAAVNDLEANGVAGPVTFQVASGTYTEQVDIGAITGTSVVNTVSFVGATGDSTDVILQFNATASDNYTLQFSGGSHIRFASMTLRALNLTYGRVVRVDGSSDYLTIEHCRVEGAATTSNSSNYSLIYSDGNYENTNVTIHNNVLQDGTYGIQFDGSPSNMEVGHVITHNVFISQRTRGMQMSEADGVVIEDNLIDGSGTNTTYYGIYLNSCDGAIRVQRNRVINSSYMALQLINCDGSTLARGLVANNVLHTSGNNTYGMYVLSSSYVDVYHNSIAVNSGSGYGAYFSNVTNTNFQNSIVATYGANSITYYEANSSIATDYNVYYGTNCRLIRSGNNYYSSLSAWQSASGGDGNSFNFNPRYTDRVNGDLSTNYFRLKAGLNLLALVSADIDGDARLNPPCIGADEFAPTSTTVLSGTITVPNDYATIGAAIQALRDNPTSGTIRLQIHDGTYAEQLDFSDLDMNGDSLIVESVSKDSSKVIITHDATNTDNYTVRLTSARNVHFRHLTLQSVSTTKGRVFVMDNTFENVSITNCFLQANNTTSNTDNMALVYTDNSSGSQLYVAHCRFENGSYGFRLDRLSGCNDYSDIVIEHNQFLQHAYAIFFSSQITDMKFQHNYADLSLGNDYGDYGLYLTSSSSIDIIGNDLRNIRTYAIYLASVDGSALDRCTLYNNRAIARSSSARLVYFASCDYWNVYHNTLLSYSSGEALYITNSDNLNLRNNVIAAFDRNAEAMFINNSANLTSDYNDFYAYGCYLIRQGNSFRNTLADWQSASGQDANSISVDPRVGGVTDPITTYYGLVGQGDNLQAEVAVDIDGEARPAAPTLGADEYVAAVPQALSGVYAVPGDFLSLEAAMDSIQEKGINGTVRLQVQPGTYLGQYEIFDFDRATPGDSLIIEGAVADSGAVILQYQASNNDENYVFRLSRASHVYFQHITFRLLDNTYARAITMVDRVKNIGIKNNWFISNHTSSTSNRGAVIFSDNLAATDVLVEGNVFRNGSHALHLDFDNSCYESEGIRILHNRTYNCYNRAIYMIYGKGVTISDNRLAMSSYSSDYGIYLSSTEEAEIRRNWITEASQSGIYLANVDGSALNKTAVYNNMLAVDDRSGNQLYAVSSDFLQVFHNSIRSNSSGYGLYLINCDNAEVKNNNIGMVNTNGRAIFVANANSASIDYNNYDVVGSTFGRWGNTNVVDLQGWQNTSGQDLNSLSVDPGFLGPEDPHTESVLLNDAGENLSAFVSIDIDGHPRQNPPYIGADEVRIDFSVSSVDAPVDGCLYNEEIEVTLANEGDAVDSVFIVHWQVNNDPIQKDTVRQLLPARESIQYILSQSYDFTSAGNYTIQAWLSYPGDEDISNDTANVVVESFDKPTALTTVGNACAQTSVTPQDLSTIATGSITGWAWSFGDGSTDTVQSPVHSYTTDGVFTITLVAISDKGCRDTATTSATIYPLPQAQFSAALSCAGDTTAFTDGSSVSSGAITGYEWDFGDGTTAMDQNPLHVFTTANVFNVQLITTTNNGCTDTVSQQVITHPTPNTQFVLDSAACEGEDLNLTNLSSISSGSIASYNWDFGDGNSSIQQNPALSYPTFGTYTVQLTATSDQGCAASANQTVTVHAVPVAGFAVDDVCDGDTVIIADLSSIANGSIATYGYSLGDGTTSTASEPMHVYSGPAMYSIQQIVVSDQGCADSVTLDVEVFANPPKPTITANGGILEAPAGFTYQWFFNGNLLAGETGQTLNANQDGSYTVEVTNNNGCSALSDPFVYTYIAAAAVDGSLNVYPVPAQQWVTVDWQGTSLSEVHLQVVNAFGQIVYRSTSKLAEPLQIDVQSWAAGTYWVQIRDDAGSHYVQHPIQIIH